MRRAAVWLAIPVAAMAGVLGLAGLIDDGGWMDRIDRAIMAGVTSDAAAPFRVVYAASGTEATGPLVALVLVGLLWMRRWRDAATLAFVAGGILAIVDLWLKPSFARHRPEDSVLDLAGFSFPSGHAAGTMALFGFIAVLAVRIWPRARGAIVVAAAGWIVAVCVSSVMVRAHWPSDVVAGAAVGVVWLILCVGVSALLAHLSDRRG